MCVFVNDLFFYIGYFVENNSFGIVFDIVEG